MKYMLGWLLLVFCFYIKIYIFRPPPKVFNKRGASLPETGVAEDSPPSSLGRRIRKTESRESITSRASTPSISERVSINN